MRTIISIPHIGLDVRADYTLEVNESTKKIWIVDENLGSMSVTNDLERVLCDVALQIERPLSEYSIIYCDSTGTWDRIIVTPHESLPSSSSQNSFFQTFNVEVRPGPRGPDEHRDSMATS